MNSSASDRVRAALRALPEVPTEEAEWLPFRVLDVVARTTGDLPQPAPLQHTDAGTVWSLVAIATPTPDPAPLGGVCQQLMRADPRIACFVDVVTQGATERVRMAVGWRAGSGPVSHDLALPLRALSRLSTGACLVSAERTARTLDLRVRVPSLRALGTSLALLSVAPMLSDILMVHSQPIGSTGALEAVLTWPTARVDRDRADLRADAFPPRCDGRMVLSSSAARGAPLTALFALTGSSARGALVAIERRQWLVTEGDQVGDAVVTAFSPQGVYVRRANGQAGRPRLVRFTGTAAGGTSPLRSRARGMEGAGSPGTQVPVPLPPEPPAPSTP